MEYCDQGSLNDYLKINNFSEYELLMIFDQVLNAFR